MANPERRIRLEKVRVERRAAAGQAGGDVAEIVGHAAVYDEWTTLYEGSYWVWREVVRPGAFDRALREKQDVRCLFNHDPNFILGRTKSGTTTLSSDKTGLFTRTVAADSQTVRDLVLTPIEREDVDGMSFAFCTRASGDTVQTKGKDGVITIEDGGQRITLRYEGDKLIEEREVLDADLFDVSPVVYPAYTGTDVSLRSIVGAEDRAKEMDRPHKRGADPRVMKAKVRSRLASIAV